MSVNLDLEGKDECGVENRTLQVSFREISNNTPGEDLGFDISPSDQEGDQEGIYISLNRRQAIFLAQTILLWLK